MMQMVIQLLNKIKYIFKRKERIRMVDMYLALVIAGRRTCDKTNKEVRLVPTRYLNAVLAELEALGLDANGNPVE